MVSQYISEKKVNQVTHKLDQAYSIRKWAKLEHKILFGDELGSFISVTISERLDTPAFAFSLAFGILCKSHTLFTGFINLFFQQNFH